MSFRVNQSPDHGTARINPDTGVELDTVFKVFFSQWRDPEGVSTGGVCGGERAGGGEYRGCGQGGTQRG